MNGQNRWLYLIKRMVYRFFDDGIPQSAAELSYFLLFSMFPLLMFVNSMLAQLDLSIEGMQPVLEMLPKSLQQLIGGCARDGGCQQPRRHAVVQPDDRRSGSDAVFPVPCGALNDAHGQRYLPR